MYIEKGRQGGRETHITLRSSARPGVSWWEQMPYVFGVGVREDCKQGACVVLGAARQQNERRSQPGEADGEHGVL